MIQRRAVAGIVFAALTSMVAGCGFEAPTNTNEHNSVQAAEFVVGTMHVDAVAVTSLSTGALHKTTYLMVTLVNDSNSSDTLTGITSSLGAVTLTGAGVVGSDLTVPAKGMPVEIVTPALNPAGPTATFSTTAAPALGTFVSVSFDFAKAGPSPTEQAPVVPPDETTAPTVKLPNTVAPQPSATGESAGD